MRGEQPARVVRACSVAPVEVGAERGEPLGGLPRSAVTQAAQLVFDSRCGAVRLFGGANLEQGALSDSWR